MKKSVKIKDEENTNKNQKILLKNIFSLGIIQVANFIMPLISVPIVSRVLGPEKFGIVNYIAVFVLYFNMFINYGFNLTATKKISSNPNDEQKRCRIFSEVLSCQLILFLISIIIYITCIMYIPTLKNNLYASLFGILFCVSSVLTTNWMFQAMQEMSTITILNILGKIIYLVLVLTMIKEENDFYLQPLILSLTQIMVAVISITWAIKKYNLRIYLIPIKESIQILKHGRKIFITTIFNSIYITANIVLLGLFTDEIQVGYYTASQRLIVVTQSIIILPLSQVFFPHLSRSFAKETINGINEVQKLIPIVAYITGCIAILIIFIGPYFLKLFYGNNFAPAVIIFQILSFVPFFSSLNNIFGIQVMLNMNMEIYYYRALCWISTISIITNIFMVKILGIIGCAINWLLTEMILCITLYYLLSRTKTFSIRFVNFNPNKFIKMAIRN